MPMPDWSYERAARKRGMRVVCGIDEAGRGPLAGPVSVAAVVLPDRFRCDGIDDSKKISEKRREVLFEKILEHRGVLWAQVFADAEEIDRKNILRATHDAMAAAVAALQEKYARRVDHCLIDGLRVPGFPHSHEGIVIDLNVLFTFGIVDCICFCVIKLCSCRWLDHEKMFTLN